MSCSDIAQCQECGAHIYYADEVAASLCEVCREKQHTGGDRHASQD